MKTLFTILAVSLASTAAQASLSGNCTVDVYKNVGEKSVLVLKKNVEVRNVDEHEYKFTLDRTGNYVKFSIYKSNMINNYRTVNLSFFNNKNSFQAISMRVTNSLKDFDLGVAYPRYYAGVSCK